jgi:hypothetical protein
MQCGTVICGKHVGNLRRHIERRHSTILLKPSTVATPKCADSNTFLLDVQRATKIQQRHMFQDAHRSELDSLRQLCSDLVACKLKIDEKQRQKLYRYKKVIRFLAEKRNLHSTQDLRKYLIKNGDFIRHLVPRN